MTSDYSRLSGWNDDPKAVKEVMDELPFPLFQDVWGSIKGSGRGKVTLLYDIIEKVSGKYPIRKQTIGDCVAHGAAYALDAIKSVDIHIHKDRELWMAETATEDIYAGSRVIIGKGRIRSGDGSVGAWAARYVNEYGALPRGKYGSVDLSTYSGSKARSWGRPGNGVPKDLLAIAKQHPVGTISKVTSYEQARDLIANGYAITIASSQGFSSRRDKDGFANPNTTWHHQMCLLGCDDRYSKKGVLCQNSWGLWNNGPKRHNQPDGSFWIDANVLEDRILSKGDSWAFSGYEGFKPQKLDTRIF